jgi:hypothetical protein
MKMKKPLSVWAVQFVLCIVTIALSAELMWFCYQFGPLVLTNLFKLSGRQVLVFLSDVGIMVVVIAFLGWTIHAIQKRRKQGRILGLIVLFALLILFVYLVESPWPPRGRGYQQYTDAEQGFVNLIEFLFFVAFCILINRFGFSRKSRIFFLPID